MEGWGLRNSSQIALILANITLVEGGDGLDTADESSGSGEDSGEDLRDRSITCPSGAGGIQLVVFLAECCGAKLGQGTVPSTLLSEAAVGLEAVTMDERVGEDELVPGCGLEILGVGRGELEDKPFITAIEDGVEELVVD